MRDVTPATLIKSFEQGGGGHPFLDPMYVKALEAGAGNL